jgi:hypothetical protein
VGDAHGEIHHKTDPWRIIKEKLLLIALALAPEIDGGKLEDRGPPALIEGKGVADHLLGVNHLAKRKIPSLLEYRLRERPSLTLESIGADQFGILGIIKEIGEMSIINVSDPVHDLTRPASLHRHTRKKGKDPKHTLEMEIEELEVFLNAILHLEDGVGHHIEEVPMELLKFEPAAKGKLGERSRDLNFFIINL